jgi:hypothetical protein
MTRSNKTDVKGPNVTMEGFSDHGEGVSLS